MSSMALYRCVAVRSDTTSFHCNMRRAPTNWQLCNWGSRDRAAMVIRYFPSRKGWKIIDIRKARRASTCVGGRVAWIGAFWLERTFPNEESAVMYALHALHSCTP